MDPVTETLIKNDNLIYKVSVKYLSLDKEKISINISNEEEKVWKFEGDLTNLIDMDKNWKKFELTEIKDLIMDCFKNSKFKLEFDETSVLITFITTVVKTEYNLKIKLQQTEIHEDKYTALLKEIQYLKSKTKYQIISIFQKNYIIDTFGLLNLKYSCDVEFKVTCSLVINPSTDEMNDFLYTCYNEDLKGTTELKRVYYYVAYNTSSTKAKILHLKFSFIDRLSSGQNKIILQNNKSKQLRFDTFVVIAKVL